MLFKLNITPYQEYRENLEHIKDTCLIQGIDYNLKKKRITDNTVVDKKPELMKSGAEKILQILNARVEYSIYKEIETELHYEVVIQADLFIDNQFITRCWGSYSTSEQSKKDEASLIVAKMSKKNNAFKLAQKRALIQIALLSSGMSEFFASDLEENEKSNKGIVDSSDIEQSSITSTELLKKIQGAKTLKDLNLVYSSYQDYIQKYNLKEKMENRKREMYIDWFNNFSQELEKCKSQESINELENKHKYLLIHKDYKQACDIAIKEKRSKLSK